MLLEQTPAVPATGMAGATINHVHRGYNEPSTEKRK